MKKRLGLAIILSAVICFSSPVLANPTSEFRQRILPMDCIYNEVNDGSGTIMYLTPKECGIEPLPGLPAQSSSLISAEHFKTASNRFSQPFLYDSQQNTSPMIYKSVKIPGQKDLLFIDQTENDQLRLRSGMISLFLIILLIIVILILYWVSRRHVKKRV